MMHKMKLLIITGAAVLLGLLIIEGWRRGALELLDAGLSMCS